VVSQDLINAVDQALIAAGLLGVGLAFFHHWRGGSPWSPLLCAISGGVILLVTMMLGLNNDHVFLPALLFLVTAPLTYYITGLVRYALIVRNRRMNLNAVWAKLHSDFQPVTNPVRFWSPLSYSEYEKAYRRIEAAVKSTDEQAAQSVLHKVITQHRHTLTRKKVQNEYLDEYGVVQQQDWKKHAHYFISQVFLPELRKQEIPVNKPTHEWIALLDAQITYQPEEDLDRSFADVKNGVEYEHYVAWVLSSAGWTPQMTPGSGDHGADIIASLGGFRVAVQCKLYSSPVGNTSVQEVYSAKDFYGCHYAVVVSNAEFTRAARKISSSLGVALVHHDDLLKIINAAKANLTS
jgi:hypothetical protein